MFLNYLGNYIPNEWTETKGCVHCVDNDIQLSEAQSKWPQVLMGVFVEKPTPFLSSVLDKLTNLNYPHELIDLFVHTTVSIRRSLYRLRAWLQFNNYF